MGIRISDREGSLKGYDIVLSVSEEAINQQLQKLYDTKITKGLPPPTKLKDFVQLPQPKHLINHDFSLHAYYQDEDDKEFYEDPNGIDGHIEAPKLRFRPRDQSDESAKFRKAHVELTFKRDEAAPEGKKDSLLSYTPKRAGAKPKSMIINGYTISWQVNIAQQKMVDVVKGNFPTAHDLSLP